MKILVDNGVVSASSFLVSAARQQELRWGTGATHVSIAGFKRIELDDDPNQQREKDALFTIGRLAKAGRITLHTYIELTVENHRRDRGRIPLVNAFGVNLLQNSRSPLERSEFRGTLNIDEWIAKGGRKDRKKGVPSSDFRQISYFAWLASLSPEQVTALISHAGRLSFDDFEIASLRDLQWFQSLARALASPENLPDCFHLWAARRNGLNAFLTLEKALPRKIEQLNNRHRKEIHMNILVLRPTGLLSLLGIKKFDPVPVKSDRFYSYGEALEINRRLIEN